MKVSRILQVVVTGLVAGRVGAAVAADEAPAVGAAVDVSALSAYVWRGQVLNDEAVVQPAATITKGGFSLNTWGNFNLTDEVTGESADFSEIDITAAYSKTVGSVTLSGGLIDYVFPNQVTADGAAVAETREVYASASLGSLPVVPALALYYDFDEADGLYALASLAYSSKLAETVALGLGASVAYATSDYNAFYFGVNDDAFNDANFGVSLAWTPCSYVTLTPGYQYTMLVDSDIEDAADALYKDKDQSIVSLKASHVF